MSRTNLAPRKVWTGFIIPGKKMMKLVTSEDGMGRGEVLIDLYKREPTQALFAAACALDALPREGAQFGPALRDLSKGLSPGKFHGAILTDIRDFLKLRFRADCPPPSEFGGPSRLLEELAAGRLPVVASGDPERAILCAILSLDTLSREGIPAQFDNSARTLRDLLTEVAVELAPERSRSTYEETGDSMREQRPRAVE